MKKFMLVFLMLIIVLSFASGSVIAQESTLRIARPGDIGSLDPAYLVNIKNEFTIMNCLYNGLVKYKSGSWEIVPDLAEKWEISKDGKEITFWLREGIQFHHGYGEMTAEDVKFSFDRIINPQNASPEDVSWAALDHVEVIDKYTVKLVLKEPSARLFTSTLPMNAGFIVSKKAVEDVGKVNFNFYPIGTGPYEFVYWIPNQETMLTAFKDYWGEPPKIKNLKFIPISEDLTIEMALETGEIDVAVISEESIHRFQENSDISVHLKPGLATFWIFFTVNKPPLDNIKVRQALRYAIDVDEIIKAVYAGIPDQAYTLVPPGILGYWKDAPRRKIDIEKAKKLLAEAGYPDGLTLTMVSKQIIKGDIVGEVIQSQLKKIGVDLKIDILEVGAYADAAKKGTYNMLYDRFSHTVDPGYISMWFVCGQAWNLFHWCNEEYDKLWHQGEVTLDFEKRAGIYQKMEKIMDEDAIAVWVTHGVRPVCMQKYVDPGSLFPNGRLAPWLMSINK